jgi:tetratricopeptide (TPR) repeat protein
MFLFLISNAVSAQNTYTKLCNEGFAYEKAGNLDGAIGKYTDAIIENPKNFNGYNYRAKAYFKKQNYDEAVNDISKAINISPGTVSLYEVRAECYKAKGTYDKAESDYAFVISKTGKADKQLDVLYFKKGQILYNLKRYEESISDFNQSIKLSENDPQKTSNYYNWRGLSFFRMNRFADASRDFETYLSSHRDDVQAVFFQGMAYLKTGENAKAKVNAQRIIDLDPTKEMYFTGDHLLDIYDLEMRRRVVKKSVEEAHAAMDEAKTITSKSLANIKLTEAFAKLNTAWLYASGIEQEDRDFYQTILKDIFIVHSQLKDKPEIPEAARKYMVQATSATTSKNYTGAIILWNKVLAIAPYYPNAYFNKALLYENIGDFRSSIENMNKYIELYPDAKDARGAKDKIYEWEGKQKTQPVQQIASEDLMQNEVKPYKPAKAKFFIRGGLSMPTANTAEFNKLTYATATEELWKTAFLKDGTIGLKQGFFAEIGLSLDMSVKPRKVKFYYNPFALAYSQNKLDLSTKGGITVPAVNTKPLSSFEIAQRYGISYEPVSRLLLAGFYRPAFLFPFGFEITQKAKAPDQTSLLITSKMGTKNPLTFSHTLGISLGYSFVTVSYESFFAKAGYDVTVKYDGATDYSYSLQGRIPMHANRIGIAFSF